MHTTSKQICIKRARVVGIKNAKFTLHYYSENPSPNFKLMIDGDPSDYHIIKMIEESEYMIESVLPKGTKRVSLSVIEDDQEHLLWRFRNHVFKRIFSKIENGILQCIEMCKQFFRVLNRFVILFWKEYHFFVPFKLWRKYFHDFRVALKIKSNAFYNPFFQVDYLEWLSLHKPEKSGSDFAYEPLLSILIPVYNISKDLLSKCIESVLKQSYTNFEICLADDRSTNEETIRALSYFENLDDRIKIVYRNENGHISKATNSAFEISSGEFIAFMDNDDELAPNALFEVVKALNEDSSLDFIYSDEDKIDINGLFCDPHFKPDYSPDTLLSLNYICHFTTVRRSLFEQVGGCEVGLEGAQDYDLFLKITERTNRIHHIPKILYHWRMIPGSTAASLDNKDYASNKGKIALENALRRRKISGTIEVDTVSSYYRIQYQADAMASIIIPMKDFADVTKRCLQSIYDKTSYKNFEILLINNRSCEQASYDLFDYYQKQYDNLQVIDADIEFNYSIINNMAVKQAKGDVLVFLNNDTEILSPNWLTDLVGYAQQQHIGTVGAKLLYPDMTIQHGGIILGLGGVASHAYIGSAREDNGMYGRLRVPYNYSGVTAACLAVRKNVFYEVNGFDEELSVAYNDVDLNLKILESGYYNVFLPQVELIHYESKSRGLDTCSEKYKRFQKEQDFMYNKWDKKVRRDHFYNPNFSYKGWFVLDRF